MLWQTNEWLLLLALIAATLLITDTGYRLGRRHANRTDSKLGEHLAALQNALFGLLALLLGFTFLMAVSRFDQRKTLALEEANAIGTAYLRADTLPEPQRAGARALLRDYVEARLALQTAGIDSGRIAQAEHTTSTLHRQLWTLAAAAAAQDPRAVPTGLFIEALNTVIDLSEARKAALDNHVPEAVLALLLVISLVAFSFLGYGCGLHGQRRFALNALFALLISFVILMILDIDRPRRGLILVQQHSLQRLQADIANTPAPTRGERGHSER